MIYPDDEQYVEMLGRVTRRSDDPDTQTACILRPTVLHSDCIEEANRIPTGIGRSLDRLVRPLKYSYIAHAEKMAVCRAASRGISTDGATVYLNWFPCADCAETLVAAGVRRLVADYTAYFLRKDDERYGFAKAMEKLNEAGVRIDWFNTGN